MAQGDLWLDEAWLLKLVDGLPTPWAVFWAISHDVAARRQHVTLTYVPGDRLCSGMPDWYIVTNADSEAPSFLTIGPGPCAASFRKRATFPASALSGMRWILYRRSS